MCQMATICNGEPQRRTAMLDVVIEQTKDAIPRDLLLLSDPSEDVIAEYIGSSTGFVARLNGNIVGALLILKTRPG